MVPVSRFLSLALVEVIYYSRIMTREEIGELRRHAGLTQREFGEMLGYRKSCAQSIVSNIETGKSAVPSKVEIILELLKAQIEERKDGEAYVG